MLWSNTFAAIITKKVSDLGKRIDKVSLIKLVEEYQKTYPVSLILEYFSVKRSTFYRWKQERKNSQKRDEIADKIEQLCVENHFIYGYRTITRLLKKVYNLVVNRKKIYRIMKGTELGKPYHVTNNKSDRDFQADKPMEKLVTDISYLYFGNCRLYLSSIMELYNREIVAYTISDCQDTDFVLDTLHQLELPQRTLSHSDQGVCLHLQSILSGLY